MRKRLKWSSMALALSLVSSRQSFAQSVDHVIGAPFTATVSSTFTKDGKITQSTIQLARASNGSTYRATYLANGEVSSIEIEDIPNNRSISITLLAKSPLDHVYRLSKPIRGKFMTDSVEAINQQLKRTERFWVEHPDRPKPNGQVHYVSLGEKNSEGMTLFGFHSERTYTDGRKCISEFWRSDLGFMLSSKTVCPGEDKQDSFILTNLRREEPDTNLFEIPTNSSPMTDQQLDANTVSIIENQTGVRKSSALLPGIEEGVPFPYQSSTLGWFEVVQNRSSSNLVAFNAPYQCPRGGPLFHYDGLLFGNSITPPGDGIVIGAGDLSKCTGGVDAAIFSDGHAEGDLQELTSLYAWRRGAYQGLIESIRHLNAIASKQESVEFAAKALPGEFHSTDMKTIQTESIGYHFVSGIVVKRLSDFNTDHTVPYLMVPSEDVERIPRIEEVMKAEGLSRDEASVVILSRSLERWRSVLEGHLQLPAVK
jgi:hypothetical protein